MELDGAHVAITDDHLHLDPKGKGYDAIREFERVGGTHIVLVTKPYHSATITTGSDYRRSFQITLDLAQRVREHTSIVVYVAVGPYPVDLLKLTETMPLSEGMRIMREGMEIAGDLILAGDAICFGEIGVPHFDVHESIMEASWEIFSYGVELAKQIDCAVVFHGPRTTTELTARLSSIAHEHGFPVHRLVKHYSIPPSDDVRMNGLTPSILAKGEWITTTMEYTHDFMLETDYIDDPNRPGAVLGPKTVPRKTAKLYRKGILDLDMIRQIHTVTPEHVYGHSFSLA